MLVFTATPYLAIQYTVSSTSIPITFISISSSSSSRFDKVLFAALQALKGQHPRVHPLHRVALRELCGHYYMMVASYMYWRHWFRSALTATQGLKHVREYHLPTPSLSASHLPVNLSSHKTLIPTSCHFCLSSLKLGIFVFWPPSLSLRRVSSPFPLLIGDNKWRRGTLGPVGGCVWSPGNCSCYPSKKGTYILEVSPKLWKARLDWVKARA